MMEDSLETRFENSYYENFNGDGDGDGIPNYLDEDDDNDGVLTKYETTLLQFVNSKKGNVKRHKKSWDYNPKTWKLNYTDNKSTISSKRKNKFIKEEEYQILDGDGLPIFLMWMTIMTEF